jgi:hypothetical protein
MRVNRTIDVESEALISCLARWIITAVSRPASFRSRNSRPSGDSVLPLISSKQPARDHIVLGVGP